MMQPFKGTRDDWNASITALPQPHFLQSWEWAQIKSRYGWEPWPFHWTDDSGRVVAAAMILKRQIIRSGFAARASILYAPKGPLLDWAQADLRQRVLTDLQLLAKRHAAIFLKIDPDVELGRGDPQEAPHQLNETGSAVRSGLERAGWRASREQIQFKNTMAIDLSASEDELLARMKQKTRYNLRLALKKGVRVRAGRAEDLPLLYKMYAETSVRDGFVIRDEKYYLDVWGTFMKDESPRAMPLIAECDGEVLAALILFAFADRAYYVYGMSRETQREKMPAYLLQWQAMLAAKQAGCTTYDLWGAPDEFDESDSLWGVYRFKQGLGAQVVRTLGAWDFAPNRLMYKFYAEIMPRVLDAMRARGRQKTQQMLG